MSAELFLEYMRTVLVPYIDELRRNEEFASESAILLLDNYIVHVEEDVKNCSSKRTLK